MENPITTYTQKITNKLKYLSKKYIFPSEGVEQAEQKFYISYLKEGMTAFDVGANIGEITLLFSRFVGSSGQVHAFEASAKTFEKLATVCQIANREQILIHHCAVADVEGMLQLNVYDPEYSGWNSLANRPLQDYGIDVQPTHREAVKAITLDHYCEAQKIDYIDLLKIDVEGAEYQVMLGASALFKSKRIRCCVFEFGQTTFDMGNTPEQLESFCKEHGYTIRNIVRGTPTFPGRTSRMTAEFSLHIATPKATLRVPRVRI